MMQESNGGAAESASSSVGNVHQLHRHHHHPHEQQNQQQQQHASASLLDKDLFPHIMDEEEQERFVAELREENDASNEFYKKLFAALLAAVGLTYLVFSLEHDFGVIKGWFRMRSIFRSSQPVTVTHAMQIVSIFAMAVFIFLFSGRRAIVSLAISPGVLNEIYFAIIIFSTLPLLYWLGFSHDQIHLDGIFFVVSPPVILTLAWYAVYSMQQLRSDFELLQMRTYKLKGV